MWLSKDKAEECGNDFNFSDAESPPSLCENEDIDNDDNHLSPPTFSQSKPRSVTSCFLLACN